MHNALAMRLGECRSNLSRVADGRFGWEWPSFQLRCQRFALYQFHDQVVIANIMQRADVGVIERGNDASLTLETGTELLMNDLNGNVAAQTGVHRAKNLPHAALAEFALDPIRTQQCAGR